MVQVAAPDYPSNSARVFSLRFGQTKAESIPVFYIGAVIFTSSFEAALVALDLQNSLLTLGFRNFKSGEIRKI